MTFFRLTAAAAMTALVMGAGPARAVEEDDDSAPPKPTATTTECTDGKIWDDASKTCVDARDARVNDEMRHGAARELAYAGRYADALRVLETAENPRDPRILNTKGFATRKAGDTQQAMIYYQAALAIDPDYILARSYMGMGLAEAGDLAGARAQLVEIAARGGSDSWAYRALRDALRGNSGY